ncbi:FKBP-type peptidyl-prolyl cis-trans isomerase [Sphingomonas sp.]|uniref:FKBP-type peptidyl-prolyl cis-trans isomerase n=1 Tax=Sphingomonas sp. TaxID=28214 RepID=UPI0025DE01B1|nr:FKBP-type peptidyl-prolyl cis-trans isomerase [Sphingomonas sp.]
MNHFPRAMRHFVSAMPLSLLVLLPSAEAATVRKPAARPPAAAPKPIVANNSIIPLPLKPIVPAAQRLCGVREPSGLGYTMLRPATGPMPSADATVLVNYIGYLAATGEMFDQGMRSPLPLDGVIPGFAQGLQKVGRTGVIRLCIPAAMGYGDQASGPIPANSDLVFQIELLDFRTPAEMEEMRKATSGEPAPQQDAPPQP